MKGLGNTGGSKEGKQGVGAALDRKGVNTTFGKVGEKHENSYGNECKRKDKTAF